jgi:Ca-activated chloride channel family protein
MNWLYQFSTTEFIFIGLFVLLYVLYIGRVFWVARQLNTSAWGVVPKFFLRGSYLVLLIVALLGPSFGEASEKLETTARDVFMIVDVSRSMAANDIVPSRLERVKYDVQQLSDTLLADRFGIILTAAEPFVLSPLTADHSALKQFVQHIQPNPASSGGTDLCSAVALARQKLVTDSTTRQSTRALILFSDGENFGPCERAELGRLRLDNIPLITVGIGTEAGSSIRDGAGFVRDNDNQIVRSRLNRSFLQNLARDSRGRYVEADADGHYVYELAGILRSLQGPFTNQQQIAISTNKYYYFLLIALGLVLIDLLVTFRTFRL